MSSVVRWKIGLRTEKEKDVDRLSPFLWPAAEITHVERDKANPYHETQNISFDNVAASSHRIRECG
jgi:hypothetical protein